MNEGVTPPIVVLCLFVVVSCGSWIRMVESTCFDHPLCSGICVSKQKCFLKCVGRAIYSYPKDD